jgi:putative transposase
MERGSPEVRTGRHCVFILHAHLVFVTKYRREVLRAEHLDALERIFRKVCADFGAELRELNGEDSHVHLLVTYPPTVALAKLVNSLKGVSSRLMRRDFPELERHCWQGHLWSASYFAGSVGGAPLSVLKHYIEQQRRPSSRSSPPT